MKPHSILHTLACLPLALGYYFQVDAPGTGIDKYWVRAHKGVEDPYQNIQYAVFDFVEDQSLAWPDFHTILGLTFGPENQPLGFSWYLITTTGGGVDIEIEEDLDVDSSLPFYACRDTYVNPDVIGDNYAWYASFDVSIFTTTDYLFSSLETGLSSETGAETETETETESETTSDITESPSSELPDPPTSSTDIETPDTETETPDAETPDTTEEILSYEPETFSGESEITPAPSLSENLVDRAKRDDSESSEVTLPQPYPLAYPVNFSTCIPIKLKAVNASDGPATPSCSGTACCRTYCYYSCNTLTTGCPAPSCYTSCENGPSDPTPGPSDPSPDPNGPDPTPTPVPPCSTCTPVPCSKCSDPNAWEVPGCPTCVRTVTNYVYTCPSLTTITVRTCPTVNKCGTKVITAPPGEVTISGLAVIDATEKYTTVLPQTTSTGASGGRTTVAGPLTTSSTGFSGGSRALSDLMVAILALVMMLV